METNKKSAPLPSNDMEYISTARKQTITIVVLYVITKVMFYIGIVDEQLWLRIFTGAVLIAAAVFLTKLRVSRTALSVIVPAACLTVEFMNAWAEGGDRMLYFFIIGITLNSLSYGSLKGLFISGCVNLFISGVFFFGIKVNVNGHSEALEHFTMTDEVFFFSGMVGVIALVFVFGKSLIRVFSKHHDSSVFFNSLLESSGNLKVMTNNEGRIAYASQSFTEFFSIGGREYIKGVPFIDIFPFEAKPYFAGLFKRTGLVSEPVEINLSGKKYWFSLRSVQNDVCSVSRCFEFEDITTIMEANKEVERSQQKAVAANQAKSNFLATMSHEIRTPMNSIIGTAQIQLQDDLPEKYEAAFERIYDSGTSLLGIINDILDLSKIEAGKMELNPSEYDVPSFIHDTLQSNVVRIGSKMISVVLDVEESLPSRLIGDELRLKQVMNNVLSNAIKYTEKGTVTLTIRHWELDDGSICLQFSVTDTGQGMKPEDVQKLFTEYSRFNESANQKVEGTGLGLNIMKNLIQMMNGEVHVESEYGVGSTFTITVVQGCVDCAPIGDVAEKLKNFAYSGKRVQRKVVRYAMPYGKVLVIDDVPTNLYVAEGLLSPYKLTIETGSSGFAALNKIAAGNTYDIVFMDHMMPEMDGIETTHKLRKSGYKGIIIALTANALVGNDEMFKANGFDDFIPKPIDIRHMDKALNKYIRDRHPEEAAECEVEQAEAPLEVEAATTAVPALDPKLLQIFRKDAEAAVVTLRETVQSGNIKLFTTTAHAMKSALANVGETEKSALAFSLEKAGDRGDTAYIAANIDEFIKELEELITGLTPDEATADDSDIVEDTEFLKAQLLQVKAACEDYDDVTACKILDTILSERQWRCETVAALDEVRDLLLLECDYDGAARITENMC